jgi:hypothetical protein
MARFDSALVAFILLTSCVPALDESGRGCPCAAGFVCCEAQNACLPSGALCADDTPDATTHDAQSPLDARSPLDSSPPDAPASIDATAIVDAGSIDATAIVDAGSIDATAIVDAGSNDATANSDSPVTIDSGCGALPAPVAHFTFADCDAGGVYRDDVGGLVGLRRGSGVHCAQSPHGAALAFDGDEDGGFGGSYVRVMDSADAGEHTCVGACRPVPAQFRSALTVSVLLKVNGSATFSHILGQWYEKDSYLLLTEADANGHKMEFSVQPSAADAGSTTVSATFPGDTWIHWIAVFDGQSIRLYQDGVEVDHRTLDAPAPLQCTDVPLELGQIGRNGACGGDIDYAYYRGEMGDLRLFDVALTPAQIKALTCDLNRP